MMMMMANVIKKLSCHNNLAVTFNDAAPCCIPVCSESFTVDKKIDGASIRTFASTL